MEHVDNNLGNISIEIDGFSITNDMFDYQIKETDDYILFADKYNPNNTFRVDITQNYLMKKLIKRFLKSCAYGDLNLMI